MTTLQKATEADIPQIRGLAERIWWAHYIEIITDEQIRYMLDEWYSEALIRSQMMQPDYHYWMIETDEPCGYVAVSIEAEAGAYYLNKFYVESRGKGIGTSAFMNILDTYPDLRLLRLNVNRRNIKSINFYFKMGFKIESVTDLQVGDRYIMDDYVMIYRR